MKLEIDLNVPYQMRAASKFLSELADDTDNFFKNLGGPGSTMGGNPIHEAPLAATATVTEIAPKRKAKKAEAETTQGESGANNLVSDPSALSSASPNTSEVTVSETAAEAQAPIEQTSAVPPAASAAVDVKPASIDDVRHALATVNSALGLEDAKKALAEFGANRVSELKPEDFGAFVAHCNSLIG